MNTNQTIIQEIINGAVTGLFQPVEAIDLHAFFIAARRIASSFNKQFGVLCTL